MKEKVNYEALSIEEKEAYYMKALNFKEDAMKLNEEQEDYEFYSQLLYEDEIFVFWKNYGNFYGVEIKSDLALDESEWGDYYTFGRTFGGLEIALDCKIRTITDEKIKSDETLREHLRKVGFPLSFKVWEE